MKAAILGDIHSNYEALDSVLEDIRRREVDAIVHVGDVVGYCTDFAECIRRLRAENVQGVHGNHDLMVLGLLDTDRCVPSAREAVAWTRSRLTEEVRSYLVGLPASLTLGDIIVFHASPGSVERAITTVEDARRAFTPLDERSDRWFVAFHGHTHKQRVFELCGRDVRLVHSSEGIVTMDRGARYLVSAGSVGQSRDTDPRTGYVLYDDRGKLELIRLDYDWRTSRRKIRAAGLKTELFVSTPSFATRLARWAWGALRSMRGVS